MDTTDNPYAPPVAHVADIAGPGEQVADRGSRFLAFLVDAVVHAVSLVLVSLVLPWKLFEDASPGDLVRNALVGLALFMVIQGWLIVTRGQTLGKLALGLRIVRPDGQRVGAARILGLRYGLGFVLGSIPFIGVFVALVDSLLIFRASHCCLHDQIADTIVVKA